jgi:hypothetical protein
MDLRTAIWNVLGFGVLPLWLLAGAADWLCHRRTLIERTSGPGESAFHMALLLLIAVPAVAGLWLEINSLLLCVYLAAVVAHMAFSLWDTAFSQPRRYISPFEQQVHGYLEMLPLFAVVMLALLHLDALATPEWRLVPRARAAPPLWTIAMIAGFTLSFALIVEEWTRGLRRSPLNGQAEVAPSASAEAPRP